jgi:L-threonylcarbamoyladenylate synthase
VKNNWKKAEEILKNGSLSTQAGVVVLPTDTLYGMIGNAQSKKAVEKIYKIKGRNENKPFIVLISSYKDLEIFGIKLNEKQAKFLKKIWPGKVSVILPCKLAKWKYIHRGVESVAFRMIGNKNKNLFNLIKKVGPLVAPSCNKQGEKPAESIKESKEYFKDDIDLYIDGGTRKSVPSTLIKYENNDWLILRQGQKKI